MTNKEKLIKIKKLADAMYVKMQYLTTDTSGIRKAMEEYHQFLICEYCKEEPVNEELEEAAWMYYDKNKPMLPPEFALQRVFVDFFKAGAQWQKQQMMKDAVGLKINRSTLYDLKPIIHERYQDFKIGDKVKLIIIKDE